MNDIQTKGHVLWDLQSCNFMELELGWSAGLAQLSASLPYGYALELFVAKEVSLQQISQRFKPNVYKLELYQTHVDRQHILYTDILLTTNSNPRAAVDLLYQNLLIHLFKLLTAQHNGNT